jgi:hypothetical protein
MRSLKLVLCAAAMVPLAPAQATDFTVGALVNSSSGGVPLPTISVLAGQVINVSASTNDLWSAGALPRFSDANGLIAVRIAQPTDDSGPADGVTQIGANFGLWMQDGFSAPFGSLVGRVGSQYQLLGTNFTGSFSNSGVLELFFWDQNNGDNTGTITAHITTASQSVLPEPGTWALMTIGFGAVGLGLRRRRKAANAPA